MANLVILGAQWGDEGKGKIVDLFSETFDVVVRYQGGHNAGHTVRIGERTFILKLIPSGILRPGKQAVIGNGLVIDPEALLAEIEMLESMGVDIGGQLSISNRAHIICPFHRVMEKLSEARPGKVSIGTTSRGIGPSYEDKAGRRGIRVADLLDPEYFTAAFAVLAEEKERIARAFDIWETIGLDAARDRYLAIAERIRPLVRDTARQIHDAMRDGRRVLFEGAQGTMLDIDHGTYPFVTSSNASAGGVSTGAGVPPTCIEGVVGVSKAYITRVGAGPFPTEDKTGRGDRIRELGREFGTVTGRPRRCGWFDVPLLRYTAMVNGFDSLAITKLDVLDGLDEVLVCTAYRLDGREVEDMPATSRELERLEPVYTTLPGWRSDTTGARRYEDLPANARAYLQFLEKETGIEVGSVSTGPERTQTIVRAGSRLESLLAAPAARRQSR